MTKSREEMDRHNARRRAKAKAAKSDVSAEIELIYEKPIEEWDDEEITRGRPRGRDGTFRGKRPGWLTTNLQAERQRRLRQLMADELATFAADALRTIHSVMMDNETDDFGKPRVPASVQVDCGKYLVDQFIGKATATIDVHADNALTDMLADVIVNRDGNPSHLVIEGAVVEDDPSDDEDDDGPVRQYD